MLFRTVYWYLFYSIAMSNVILYYIVLYCTILYYIVLYSTVLYLVYCSVRRTLYGTVL